MPHPPQRRTLVVSGLFGGGGTERVVADLATRWSAAGHAVTVVTLSGRRPDEPPLPTAVARVALDVLSDSRGVLDAVRANVRRITRLRTALVAARPERIVSFGDRTNVTTLLAATGLGIPVVVSERTDPDRAANGRAWTALRRRTYRRAAAIVVPAAAMRSAVARHVGPLPVTVIPNAIRPDRPAEAAPLPSGPEAGPRPPHVVAAGRLDPQKGFDLLLAALPRVLSARPDVRLTIAGEGPERARLEALAASCPPGTVALPGYVADLPGLLRTADLFVLPSRTEGLPNALLEALAAGLACVSFDCPTGPAELIADGVTGRLVPAEDVPALADAIVALLADGPLRRRLGRAAAADIRARFAPAAIDAAWDELLARAAPA